MKNVTISMDEETLQWVRLEAGRAGVSVSRWVADQLGVRGREAAEKAAASRRIEKFLAEFPGLPLSENGKIIIDRDEL
jgi:predicted nucleic acid-binding protein